MSADDFDHRTISAEDYELMIAKAISDGQLVAATEILQVMVAVHPREAVRIHDDIQAALRLRKVGRP